MKRPLISNIKLWVALIIIVIFTVAVAAQRAQHVDASKPVQAHVPVLRDVLFLSQTQISSFDPLDAFHEGHIQIVKQIYETLTDVDAHGDCVPLLASKWETSDNRIWRFHIENNIFFSSAPFFASIDERRLVAKDVVYSFERLLSPESKSLGIAYFKDIVGFDAFHTGRKATLAGVRAISSNIVEFELTKPDAGFYCRVSIPFTSIVKQKAVEQLGDNFKLKPIGTGPFVLEAYDPDQQIILRRNPEFRKGLNEMLMPDVEKVIIRLTRDTNVAFSIFASKASDFLVLDFAGMERLRQEEAPSSWELSSQPTAKFQFYLFNLQTISEPETRKVINAVVNRRAIQRVIGKSGTIAKSIFPEAIFPELSGKSTALTSTAYPHDSHISLKASSELRIVCFNDVLSRAIASRVADDLQKYGYTVRIEATSFPVLVERLMRGEYDLIQIYWGPMYADPVHYLSPFLSSQFPPNGNNFNRYSNSIFDAHIKSAKTATDPELRNEHLLKAEEILLQDMPLLPLYFENLVRVSNKKFSMPMHPLLYRNYNKARPR